MKLIPLISKQFTQGHARSIKAKKNILGTFLIQGLSIGISLLMVPIVLNYISPTKYGVWLTIQSIVGWFSFFNIGLTQGLRNRFAEAIAKNEHDKAKIYVSTTYAILGIIFTSVWLAFIVANNFLDWTHILNVETALKTDVTSLAVIVFTYFCISFVLKVITTLIRAIQQPALASLVDVLGQALSLLIVFILIKTTEGSLVKLGLALCLAPLAVLILANFIFFRHKFKLYKPNWKFIDFKYSRDLFSLGLKFFIIQVAGIIQYQTANIIIAQYFGTLEVTNYNIVYKYFGMLLMGFTIFITPLWSATTEAYSKGDIQWIKNSIKKYNYLNLLVFGLGILMLLASSYIYDIWLGKDTVKITMNLSLWGFVYFNVMIFGSKYVHFLNGINALKIQFLSSIVSPVIYIICAFIMINQFHFGVKSLFISSIIANLNGFLLAPIQYHMVINKKLKGIWIK